MPREAREGLMRAWLTVLHERHPQVTWVATHVKATSGTAGKKKNVLASASTKLSAE
jgi:hypothetical protein